MAGHLQYSYGEERDPIQERAFGYFLFESRWRWP